MVSNFAKSDLNKYCLTATYLLGEHPSPPQNMRGICLHMSYTSNHYAVDEAGRTKLELRSPAARCLVRSAGDDACNWQRVFGEENQRDVLLL